MAQFSPQRTLHLSASIVLIAIGMLALPALARAADDLAITQTQSATVIDKGGKVTFTVEVKNVGTVDNESVFAELDSLAAYERGADDPYLSFSTSQGSCKDVSGAAYGTVYHVLVCELGALKVGAKAQITATVQANQSAYYTAALLPNAFEGGYSDANNSNNSVTGRVTVSTPPVVSGSRRIKLTGLPTGCATGNFTFRAVAKAKGVKKMKAVLFYWDGDEGVTWTKRTNGNALKAQVPVSKLSNELEKVYKLKIKAKRRGGKPPLITIVSFQPC
jgi:hypothetical protein